MKGARGSVLDVAGQIDQQIFYLAIGLNRGVLLAEQVLENILHNKLPPEMDDLVLKTAGHGKGGVRGKIRRPARHETFQCEGWGCAETFR